MDKLILCLANSYKHGGRCIAGIEVEIDDEKLKIIKSSYDIPVWIRPISHFSAGEVPMSDASKIGILSLVKVHNVSYAGSCSHSEDYYYESLEMIQTINPSDTFLKQCIDSYHYKIFSNRGKALTINAFKEGDYSLMFIRTENSEIYLEPKYIKPRIKFYHNGNQYDFPITDPEYLNRLHNDTSLYKSYKVLYIVISLAVEHEGWHSKLAATIISPAISNIKEHIVKIETKSTCMASKLTDDFPIFKPANILKPSDDLPKPTYKFNPINIPQPTHMSTSNNSSNRNGGCYVATSIYGSYDCPEVWTLRRFRDYKLAESYAGQSFIKVYYATSPLLVKWFGHTKCFKHAIKPILDKIVRKLKKDGYKATPYQDKKW